MEIDPETTAVDSWAMRVDPESIRFDSESRCYVSGTHPETTMLTEITLAGYGPIKEEITLRPTPLHALIGPNDSGKSSILNATVETVSGAIDRHDLQRAPISTCLRSNAESLRYERKAISQGSRTQITNESWTNRVALFKPNSARLKEASGYLPDSEIQDFLKSGGKGLPGLYALIRNRANGEFESIAAALSALFPWIERLDLKPFSGSSHVSEVVAYLRDGTCVPAQNLSDGIVFFLAFAALRYTTGIKTILLEEPENGLHPARIRDLVKVLRATSETGIQIILTTHSPLVLNEMKPEEVTIVTRHHEKGTQVQEMLKTPFFKERSEVFTLGELWLANCDGYSEQSLLHGVIP